MSSAESHRTSNRHRLLHAGNDWLPTPQDCEGMNPRPAVTLRGHMVNMRSRTLLCPFKVVAILNGSTI